MVEKGNMECGGCGCGVVVVVFGRFVEVPPLRLRGGLLVAGKKVLEILIRKGLLVCCPEASVGSEGWC